MKAVNDTITCPVALLAVRNAYACDAFEGRKPMILRSRSYRSSTLPGAPISRCAGAFKESRPRFCNVAVGACPSAALRLSNTSKPILTPSELNTLNRIRLQQLSRPLLSPLFETGSAMSRLFQHVQSWLLGYVGQQHRWDRLRIECIRVQKRPAVVDQLGLLGWVGPLIID